MADNHVTDEAVASDVAKEITEAIVTDETVKANVSNMPGEADVVADTVNVFDEAVDAVKAVGAGAADRTNLTSGCCKIARLMSQ